MRNLFIQNKENLKDILRFGVLRTEAMEDCGLYDGKLGMSILFYEYARYSGDILYEQFADEMLESLLNLPDNLPLGFSNGLSGIGWGITYLLRNDFVVGDIDEILLEVDERLMRAGNLLDNDVKALLTYVRSREAYMKELRKEEKCMTWRTSIAGMFCIGRDYLTYDEGDIKERIWENWNISKTTKL